MNVIEKTSDINRKFYNGFLWQNLFIVVNALLQLVAITVLSRLLSPGDFGLMAIALIFVALSSIISQMGIGPAIVQREVITERHVRVGFSLSVCLGIILTLLLIMLSDTISVAFDDVRLSAILYVVAFSFFFGSLSSVSEGILTRELRFRSLVKINLLSFAIGNVLISIVLAFSGFGVWALAFGVLAQSILKCTLCYLATRHSLKPLLSIDEVRELLYFGGGFTITRLFNFGATQGDNFVIGLYANSAFLGHYNRAYQLMMLPVTYIGSTVEKLMFPLMSRQQNDKVKLKQTYLIGCSLLSFFVAPISALIFVNADDIVQVLLGNQWNDTIAPLEILSLAIVFRTTYKMGDSLAKSVGAVYARSIREAIYFVCIVAGAFLGLRWGLTGVAYGVFAAILINFSLTLLMSRTILSLQYSEIFKAYLNGFLFFFVTLFISYMVKLFLSPISNSLIALSINFIITAILALVVIIIIPKMLGRDNIIVLTKFVKMTPAVVRENKFMNFIFRRFNEYH